MIYTTEAYAYRKLAQRNRTFPNSTLQPNMIRMDKTRIDDTPILLTNEQKNKADIGFIASS